MKLTIITDTCETCAYRTLFLCTKHKLALPGGLMSVCKDHTTPDIELCPNKRKVDDVCLTCQHYHGSWCRLSLTECYDPEMITCDSYVQDENTKGAQ